MSLIETGATFVGGLFFAAAFPQPSALIRAGVISAYNNVRARFSPAPPAPPAAKE